MTNAAKRQKLETFNFRLEPELKAAFTAAADAEDRPAAQVLREFMRGYVSERERADFLARSREASAILGREAQDPASHEAQILRELDQNFEDLMRDEPEY